jgi:hypothetical protein
MVRYARENNSGIWYVKDELCRQKRLGRILSDLYSLDVIENDKLCSQDSALQHNTRAQYFTIKRCLLSTNRTCIHSQFSWNYFIESTCLISMQAMQYLVHRVPKDWQKSWKNKDTETQLRATTELICLKCWISRFKVPVPIRLQYLRCRSRDIKKDNMGSGPRTITRENFLISNITDKWRNDILEYSCGDARRRR